MNVSELAGMPLSERNRFPVIPAVYFLFYGSAIEYIGQTDNLNHRWFGHSVLTQLDKGVECYFVRWLPEDNLGERRRIEREMLKLFRPRFCYVKIEKPPIKVERLCRDHLVAGALTASEVANKLDISAQRVRQLANGGLIDHYWFRGKSLVITPLGLEQAASRNRKPGKIWEKGQTV
jgi:hypothetical protein